MGRSSGGRKPSFFLPPKRRTYRQRLDGEWVTLFADQFMPKVWNLGASIHPRRRAQSDWYYNKKNKRSRSASKRTKLRDLRGVRILLSMLKQAVSDLPSGHHAVVMISHEGSNALGRYLERLGFIAHQGGTETWWVLTALQRKEDHHLPKHTNASEI